MNTDNSLTLPDGRKLACAELGRPDGVLVRNLHAPHAAAKHTVRQD
jgi:hypothetical protein